MVKKRDKDAPVGPPPSCRSCAKASSRRRSARPLPALDVAAYD